MKLISWLFTLVILALALCFALNNRQSATISLWPFGIEMEAPLYLLSLGTLFLGLLLGSVISWLSHLSHRLEARRLRRDIAALRARIEDLRQTVPPAEKQVGEDEAENEAGTGSKWRFWESRS